MSQPKSEAIVTETNTEDQIAGYLRSHPDFFERHPQLLLALKLPHSTSGATVSLVERQVSVLRQRNGQLERQLKDLIAVARQNDELVEKSHRLAVRLMATEGMAGRVDLIETALREDFSADRAVLVLFADQGLAAPSRSFVRVMDRENDALKPFATFLRSARPRCGMIRERQRDVLFEHEAVAIRSAAMIPLGTQAELGFLAVGSQDVDHFHPGQRLDFLSRLGELITAALTGAGSVDAAG